MICPDFLQVRAAFAVENAPAFPRRNGNRCRHPKSQTHLLLIPEPKVTFLTTERALANQENSVGTIEQSVSANLLAERFGSFVGKKLVPNGKRAAVLAPSGFLDKSSTNDFGLHPPVVVSAHISESPPDAGMIGVMIREIARFWRVISRDSDPLVWFMHLLEVGAGCLRVIPDIGGERFAIDGDLHLSLALLERNLTKGGAGSEE